MNNTAVRESDTIVGRAKLLLSRERRKAFNQRMSEFISNPHQYFEVPRIE